MSEKVLNTRIQLRYDSFTNWQKGNNDGEKDRGALLKKGELAVAYLAETKTTTTPDNETHPIMFKVGPGYFNELPWASALAADVYAWAKNPNKPTYDADEIKVDTENNHFNGKGLDAALTEIWNEIIALTGGEEGAGAIADQIAAGIKAIQGATATAGNYVTGVSIDENGNLKLSEAALPTLATGDTDGTVKFDGVNVAVRGLGSAAYKDENAFVASVSNANASIAVSGDSTAPQIAVALSAATDNAITLENDGLKVVIPNAAEYSIAKDSVAAEGYAATYHLTKDGTNIGAAINIPKDMVVSSGSVVELNENDVEGLAAGTYIKLILANANNEELYIPVGSLIEYVTSGSQTGDMVFIAVDETTHQITATITDGTISFAKLDKDTQEKINKAGTVTSITAGDGLTGGTIDASGTIALNVEYVKNIKVNDAVNAEKSADSDKLGGKAASEYASKEQGGKADTALQTISAGTGLKVEAKANNNQEIGFDPDCVFIFDCGDAFGNPLN